MINRIRVVLYPSAFIDYSIQLANGLSKNADVLLILPKKKVSKENLKKINKKVKSVIINKPRSRYLTSVVWSIKILKLIRDFNPNIIHLQHGTLWFLPILPFMKKYQIVATLHDIKPHPGEETLLTRFNMWMIRKFSDKAIVHSNTLKQLLRKTYNYYRPIYVIKHGNFNILRGYTKIKEEKNWILFFGRIWEYKGLRYLIKAEPLIRKKIRDFKIVIAGRGENFDKYLRLIKNRDNFLIFNEFITEKRLTELFQKSSIVVLPYIEASQSGIIPVAYQFKKPVISTDVGALSDVIAHNKTGLLIKPKNVKQLADAIIYLLQRPMLRKKMGLEGYRFAQKELSWEKIAKKTIEAYLE